MDRKNANQPSSVPNKNLTTNPSANGSPSNSSEIVEIELLPIVYEIIRCFEKDPTDNAAKQRESQDCSQKVLELQRRLDAARAQIHKLPGINYNKDDQLERLELLRTQLKQKQQIIKKYRNLQF